MHKRRLFLVVVVTLASLAGFGIMADGVVSGELADFDRALNYAAHRIDSPFMGGFMKTVTHLGSFPIVVLLTVGIAVYAMRAKDRRGAWMAVGVVVAIELVNRLLKAYFERGRPDLFALITLPDSYSYPSGHSSAATVAWGIAAIVIGRIRPALLPWALSVAVVVIALVGSSRVYLGVHWATDVLGGILLGVALLAGTVLISSVRK